MSELPKKRPSSQVCVRFDGDVLERVDRYAEMIGITRSQMVKNFVDVALSDADLLNRFGILPTVVKMMEVKGRLQEKIEAFFSEKTAL